MEKAAVTMVEDLVEVWLSNAELVSPLSPSLSQLIVDYNHNVIAIDHLRIG